MSAERSGIYQILNKIDGKIYVGQSWKVDYRKIQHFNALSRGDHKNIHLQRAFNRDGIDNFEFSILEFCEPEFLTQREEFWMSKLSNNYNICPAGGSSLGVKRSKESRQKMSDAKKGKTPLHLMTKEARTKAAKTHSEVWHNTHKPQSDAEIQKRSESLKKRWAVTPKKKMSDEAKKRMSESAKNRKTPNRKKINHVDAMNIKNSALPRKELSKIYGIGRSQIHRIIHSECWNG